MVKRRCKAAGLPSFISNHSFRAMCTTFALENGARLEDVQDLLGHADPGTAQTYNRKSRESLPRNDDERLQLWPFPQEVPAGTDRAAMWQAYRERMISNAGVVLVVSGNKKLPDGSIGLADGVRKEVAIARGQGKPVIPIGATGHVARELWDECRANPSDFVGSADITKQLDVLGNDTSTVPEIVQAIIESLKQLDK
jgi:Sir2- and TIR-associating SLOG family/Phage integrase family